MVTMHYDWKTFLGICDDVLNAGDEPPFGSKSWCSWTTFRRLERDAGYWREPLPARDELADGYVRDGGTWGQPFGYHDLAHIIIPARFTWERPGKDYKAGTRHQKLALLSRKLGEAGLDHRRTDLVLEVKLY